MAEISTNKRFLDYGGLSKLWSIITNRFADKDKTITKLETAVALGPVYGDENKSEKQRSLIATLADNKTTQTVLLPNANDDAPGLMTPEHFAAVRDLQVNIDKFAPFAGLKIGEGADANEVSLTARKASIALEYIPTIDENGKTVGAKIALLDPNYPASGNWNVSTKEAYDAAGDDKTGFCLRTESNGAVTYYKWSVDGATGPVNALGEPIMSKPISEIDVTELLKTGMLAASDVKYFAPGAAGTDGKGGTYLELVFNVNKNGVESTETQYINVSDLVDTYIAGEGITFTSKTGETIDDAATSAVINVVAATDTTLGAFRTGYEEGLKRYAVDLTERKVDAEGNASGEQAFVYVPWTETTVSVATAGANVDGEKYLDIKVDTEETTLADGSKNKDFLVTVEASDGIKAAEALTRSGVQNIVGDKDAAEADVPNREYVVVSKSQLVNKNGKDAGTEFTVTLSDDVKGSLNLANTAVQTFTATQVRAVTDLVVTESGEANNGANKGKKAYDIQLGAGAVASLNLADSAMQTVNMMGTVVDQDTPAYTAAQAKTAMELGSASQVNYATEISEANFTSTVQVDTFDEQGVVNGKKDSDARVNVATVEAVKTYVDNVHDTTTDEYEAYVSGVVESLDSSIETTNIPAADTAQKVEARQMFTKIVINDGKLVTSETDANYEEGKGVSEMKYISINDIADFREISDAEITALCI
jgi:hypothetical protein